MSTTVDCLKHMARVLLALAWLASWLAAQCPAMLVEPPSKPARSAAPLLSLWPAAYADHDAALSVPAPSPISEAYGNLPLRFEANCGQTDPRVRFLARGRGCTLFLTAAGAEIGLPIADCEPRNAGPASLPAQPVNSQSAIGNPNTTLRMRLAGARRPASITGLAPLAGRTNYFVGNAEKWRKEVAGFERVKYKGVYPGVDLVYYGRNGSLEYDFIVAPGANPRTIRVAYTGISALGVDLNGDLRLETAAGVVRLHKPIVYQETAHARREVAAAYVIRPRNSVGFRLGPYDETKPLIIDPVLSYSTFLGSSGSNDALAVAVDAAGNAYVAGRTTSADFPVTTGSLQGAHGANAFNAFIAKFNPAGTELIYATYLGGSINGSAVGAGDEAFGIAVDPDGNAYVTGETSSTDFPTTAGALQTKPGGGIDAFVAKLNPAGGALVYSTYLGGGKTTVSTDPGQDIAIAVAIDSDRNAYVAGRTNSIDFPTVAALQPALGGMSGAFSGSDAFIAKINPSGTALIFSTYFGGNGDDVANAIAVDANKNVYIAGKTFSTNFPVTAGVLQPKVAGLHDGFVAKIDAAGASVVYSTYLGGSGDDAVNGIAADGGGNVYVTGETSSTDFPTANPFQASNASAGAGTDAFVAELNSTASAFVYSTYIGGSSQDSASGIAIDAAGNVYVTGETSSTDFPTKNAFQTKMAGGPGTSDAFVLRLNAGGAALGFSSYLGGSGSEGGARIALDGFANAYVVGFTTSKDYPVASPFQRKMGKALTDAFVAKVALPRITGVTVQGKKLLVAGDGFDPGAVITIEGRDQATSNDTLTPALLLVSKKAGKSIAPGQPVMIQVRNTTGELSNAFPFVKTAQEF